MGTKHGYTEKQCKVCGQVKSRGEFPAYGGLTCRDCMRAKEREARPERYQRDKRDPKYVEENRRRARDYKRKKKREQEGNRSAMSDPFQELIGQLAALQEQLTQQVQGPLNQLSSASEPPESAQARESNQGLIGQIPLPQDHPRYQQIAGALMNLQGMLDNLPGAWQQFLTAVQDAEAALGQVLGEIDSVIRWANGG